MRISIQKLGVIGRGYRHLARYQKILRILFKYGFADVLDRMPFERYLESGLQRISRTPKRQIERHSRPQRLRMALEELGPTFIKFGQMLSTRSDLIPAEYLSELALLQDQVPPFDFEDVRRTIRSELGAAPEALFDHIDPEPLAAASIGQVHGARLPDGEEVVLKVQRPGIEEEIATDLEILAHLAEILENHVEEAADHRPTLVVEEFARTISREIDYTVEAANLGRFARQFEGNPHVYVPRLHPDRCSERVLTMERVRGVKATDLEGLRRAGLDPRLVARRGADLILEQIFVHGFFHADPHPGNIWILPGDVICFLDFGMMGRLSHRDQEHFTDLVLAILGGDERKIVEYVLEMTTSGGPVDRDRLQRDLSDFLDRYLHLPLKELHAGRILQELLDLAGRYQLHLKPNYYLMFKALAAVEGMALVLDPDLEFIALAEPFMRRIRLRRYQPHHLAREMARAGEEYAELFRELPHELRILLAQLREGHLKIDFEHHGLHPLRQGMARSSNRIAFAIVLAAQIVGSSLVVLSDIPPKWHGIPIIGLSGFLVAGLMGFWLLLSILRHGQM